MCFPKRLNRSRLSAPTDQKIGSDLATLLSSFRLLMIREPHMSGDSGIATTLGDTRLSVREE